MRILALDLSLTATGWAMNEDVRQPEVGLIKSKGKGMPRLQEIRDAALIYATGCDLVVLEGYAYARTNQAHQLGELGGVIRLALYDEGIPFADVAPSLLKKFATGKGNATKEAMLVAAVRQLGYAGEDNNEADALFLWYMADLWYDPPNMPAAGYKVEALGKVDWPEMEVRVG